MLDGLFPIQERKTLRPHQVRAIEGLRASLGKGNRRVVLQGPVGFGKTLVAARVIEGALAKGNSVVFTAPMISLIDQTVDAFEAEGVRDIGVMQANHPRTNRLARVQIASVQTLARRDIPNAALVIVDEAHIRSAVIDKLMADRPDVFFVGLTATPWAKGMGLRWQDLVIPCTIQQLIDTEFLSRFRVFAPDVPDLTGVKVQNGDYIASGLEEVMGDAKLVGSVVGTWMERGEARPTLCFAVNRAHAAQIQQEFERAGVSAAYVDGETDMVERARIGRKFRQGEFAVICSVRTMTTGVDLPVSCIIDAAPTKSEILHVQKIGRGLRINPGTEDLLILDHAGNSLRLGLVSEIRCEHLDRSKPGEKPEDKPKPDKLPKPCSECGALHSGPICPACGHHRKPPRLDEADGELVEITGKKAVTMADKQRRLAELRWIAADRGYKPGWAAQKFKTWHGTWPPNGMDPAPIPPSREVINWVKSQQIRWAKAQEKIRGAA
jgi:DNA repair protein RadD